MSYGQTLEGREKLLSILGQRAALGEYGEQMVALPPPAYEGLRRSTVNIMPEALPF